MAKRFLFALAILMVVVPLAEAEVSLTTECTRTLPAEIRRHFERGDNDPTNVARTTIERQACVRFPNEAFRCFELAVNALCGTGNYYFTACPGWLSATSITCRNLALTVSESDDGGSVQHPSALTVPEPEAGFVPSPTTLTVPPP